MYCVVVFSRGVRDLRFEYRLESIKLSLVMRKVRRLTKSSEFVSARRNGSSRSSPLLILVTRPNGMEWSRFGFSVSRAVGGAVVRNRIKRRLRETARLANVREGLDIVLIARMACKLAGSYELRNCMINLMRSAKVLDEHFGESR